jgi:hypothetical protein
MSLFPNPFRTLHLNETFHHVPTVIFCIFLCIPFMLLFSKHVQRVSSSCVSNIACSICVIKTDCEVLYLTASTAASCILKRLVYITCWHSVQITCVNSSNMYYKRYFILCRDHFCLNVFSEDVHRITFCNTDDPKILFSTCSFYMAWKWIVWDV